MKCRKFDAYVYKSKYETMKIDYAGLIDVSEDVQETLEQRAYVHHDHGGREHGHDWDDWLKAERSLKARKERMNISE
ncbi:MAG: hypothetical protein A2Z81_06500 [Omnitrophica WOR_2 bacterium GWA2_45_18]|nr:MAG: hypothetical protein A2Z81_06500 [Omnitrophica WOR_2 bacterium GWA2_45_18]